jgi:hypothetical protein
MCGSVRAEPLTSTHVEADWPCIRSITGRSYFYERIVIGAYKSLA